MTPFEYVAIGFFGFSIFGIIYAVWEIAVWPAIWNATIGKLWGGKYAAKPDQ